MTPTDRERQHDADAFDPPREGVDDREHETDDHESESPDDRFEGQTSVVDQLAQERDAAIAAKLRAQADFVNFQRRASENEQRALTSGMTTVVRSLLPALDNLDRALDTDPARTSAEQLRDGVRMVRGEITRALESIGVTAIVPQRGEEFDPRRHEALMRQPAEDIEPDCVVIVLQVGYAMGDTVLRPAKVGLASA